MASSGGSTQTGGLQLACVEARGRIYGLDVRQVREIVRAVPVMPLPQAPPLVDGLVELRGALLPLVDLGRAMSGTACGDVATARIAVVEVAGVEVALRVDAALDVVSVDASEVAMPPALGVASLALRGVVRRSGAAPVLVLGLEELLAGLRVQEQRRVAGAESPEEVSR